jgi:GNAT superfamily N-acetyltransferase
VTVVRRLDAAASSELIPQLAEVLLDAVEGGASVGFMPPFSLQEAAAYWREVADSVAAGRTILLVAGEPVEGTVQMQLPAYTNGRHRAMVAKLLVHRSARRRGIGQALMSALEAEAERDGRTLLFFDTQTGSDAELFYDRLGWERAGIIPDFAYAPDGKVWPSTFYFKRLGSREPARRA